MNPKMSVLRKNPEKSHFGMRIVQYTDSWRRCATIRHDLVGKTHQKTRVEHKFSIYKTNNNWHLYWAFWHFLALLFSIDFAWPNVMNALTYAMTGAYIELPRNTVQCMQCTALFQSTLVSVYTLIYHMT